MRPLRLRPLMSLESLRHPRRGIAGQISTLMLLMIAGALILTLSTANMGVLAVRATGASNAVDASALLLGSELATMSHQYWDSLKDAPDDGRGAMKRCRPGLFFLLLRAFTMLLTSGPIGILVEKVFGTNSVAMKIHNATDPVAATSTGGGISGIMGGGSGNPVMDWIDGKYFKDPDDLKAAKKMTFMIGGLVVRLAAAIVTLIYAPYVGWYILLLLIVACIAINVTVTAMSGNASPLDYVLDVVLSLLPLLGQYAKLAGALAQAALALRAAAQTYQAIAPILKALATILETIVKIINKIAQLVNDAIQAVKDAVGSIFSGIQSLVGVTPQAPAAGLAAPVGSMSVPLPEPGINMSPISGISEAGEMGASQAGALAGASDIAGGASGAASALPSSVTAPASGLELTAMDSATGVITAPDGSIAESFFLASGDSLSLTAGQTVNLSSGSMQVANVATSIPKLVALGALATGATMYNIYVADQIAADALAAAAKATQGLRHKERIREEVFHTALSMTVEDPNVTRGPLHPDGKCFWTREEIIQGDPDDSDQDGDTNESVPCFQYFWFRRIQALKEQTLDKSNLVNVVKKFLGDMEGFDRTTRTFYNPTCSGGGCRGSLLTRESIEGTPGGACGSGGRCAGNQDGILIEIAREIERGGTNPDGSARFQRPIPWWEPGPSLAAVQAWEADQACDEYEDVFDPGCSTGVPPPAGIDTVDAMVAELTALTATIDELRTEDKNLIAASVDAWVGWFYEPPTVQPNDSYYYTLNDSLDEDLDFEQVGIVARLATIRNQLQTMRTQMPACTPLMVNGRVAGHANPPCRTAGGFSVDDDLEDEYAVMVSRVNTMRSHLLRVINRMKQFYDDVAAEPRVGQEYGGTNPLLYRWRDSRGDQAVMVQVSNFKVPHIKNKKGFFKTCLKLKNHADVSGANTWVRICNGANCVPPNANPDDTIRETDGWEWGGSSTGKVEKRSFVGWNGVPENGLAPFVRIRRR